MQNMATRLYFSRVRSAIYQVMSRNIQQGQRG
jgi:hypothetical protein